MSSNITVVQTPTGWHVEGVAPFTGSVFTADLPLCDCNGSKVKTSMPCAGGYHRAHVQQFVKRLAGTYQGKTVVPEVPFNASLVAPESVPS